MSTAGFETCRGSADESGRSPLAEIRPGRGHLLSKRIVVTTAALVVAASALSAAAQARPGSSTTHRSGTYLVKATLDAKQEVPAAKDATAAKGVFNGKLTLAGKKSSFVWKLSWSGLSGRAVAAHLHLGVAGKAGPVVITICGPCTSTVAQGSYHGSYVAGPAFVKAILHGGMYVNVHTKLNPKGEIRGQIRATAAG
jgi:hypothetical protein